MQALTLQQLQYNIYLPDTFKENKTKYIISANIFKETPLFFLLPLCSTSWKANKKILHLLHSSEQDLCAFLLGMFWDSEGDESS